MNYKYICKGGLPCDLNGRQDAEGNNLDFPNAKYEQCTICGRKVKFKKYRRRLNEVEYLESHPRDFCQRFGRFKKLYAQLYGLKPRDLRTAGTNKPANKY